MTGVNEGAQRADPSPEPNPEDRPGPAFNTHHIRQSPTPGKLRRSRRGMAHSCDNAALLGARQQRAHRHPHGPADPPGGQGRRKPEAPAGPRYPRETPSTTSGWRCSDRMGAPTESRAQTRGSPGLS